MLTVEVNQADLQSLIQDFTQATPRQLNAASVSAINRVSRSVESKTIKAIAAEYGVPQKVLKGGKVGVTGLGAGAARRRAFRTNATYQSIQSNIWLGLYDVKASYLGGAERYLGKRPAQVSVGSGANRHSYPGHFVARMQSGHVGVYSSDPSRFARWSRGRKGPNSQNLPIQETLVPIGPPPNMDSILDQAGDQLAAEIRRQLNYQVNVRGNA